MPDTPAQGPQTDFVGTMNTLLEVFNGRVKGAVVVKVRSFDRLACTADVEPQVLRGAAEEPVVQDVPVLFPGVQWDAQGGEYGVLLTGALNWRRWWRTGEVSAVEDADQHGLSTGILLLGLTPQADPPTIPLGAAVVPAPPVIGGKVLVGSATASKPVVHADLLADLLNYLVQLDIWGTAVGAATGVAWAPVQTQLFTITAGILALAYQSSVVEVDP